MVDKKFKAISKISVFPQIGSVVLKKDNKLIVFNPRYLLGKHGSNSKEVSSKFMSLSNSTQLLNLIDKNISSKNLSGSRIEIKEIKYNDYVGTDSLFKIPNNLINILPIENIRGNNIKILFVEKGKIPKTKLLNIILVSFDSKFGDGIEKLFKEKYKWVNFEDFESIYSVVTIFPGKYAPHMDDKKFWHKHALMKEI